MAIHLIGKEDNEDTGLYLTVVSLKGIGKDKFMIRDINNYSFNLSMNKLKYLQGRYIFELDMVTKLHLKIDINKDRSLKDVTGSKTDTLSPANVTTFRLVKDQKEITIQEINKFPLKTYNYWVC